MKKNSPFVLIRENRVEALGVNVQEYRHKATDAHHIHLAADNSENAFMVAFRTLPESSNGVAHILEHTALCGSKNFPLRDPFFKMMRRSLNTFMNAMTGPNSTFYPFATQNKKDFDNLLRVYLDAVFNCRLDELDFRQEGHRIEFSEAEDTSSNLVYKGVVFNEMKGVVSDVNNALGYEQNKYLFPTTVYQYNSGGNPEDIPDLSYDEFKEFYRVHYHPSNAIFLTYGDIQASEHHANFEDLALSNYHRLNVRYSVPDERRRTEAISVEGRFPCNAKDGLEDNTHIVVSWLLGHSYDPDIKAPIDLLNLVLLGNSAAPLRHALESSGLGKSLSGATGVDASRKEIIFSCGLQGSNPSKAEAIEKLVMGVLADVATIGVPKEQVEASLRLMEIRERELTGKQVPYGLGLMFKAMPPLIFGHDYMTSLDMTKTLDQLKRSITDPKYIMSLARSLLLENDHRVRLTYRPDELLAAEKVVDERNRLDSIASNLSEAEKSDIVEQARAIMARQQKPSDTSCLPDFGLENVTADVAFVEPTETLRNPLRVVSYEAATNGLCHQQVILPLPALTGRQHRLMPTYTRLLLGVGVGDEIYVEAQRQRSLLGGVISASLNYDVSPSDPNDTSAALVISMKCLHDFQGAMCNSIRSLLQGARFDEHLRIKELVDSSAAEKLRNVIINGSAMASQAAAANMRDGVFVGHSWNGLGAVKFSRDLAKQCTDPRELTKLAGELAELHQLVVAGGFEILLVGEGRNIQTYRDNVQSVFAKSSVCDTTKNYSVEKLADVESALWLTNTQVNFCASVYPTVAACHSDAAALDVLAGYLTQVYLHTAIREQGGAYGANVSHSMGPGFFSMTSYRDPRGEDTLKDFARSLIAIATDDVEPERFRDSILSAVRNLGRPGTPAEDARKSYWSARWGFGENVKATYKQRLLDVTPEDIKRVSRVYLAPDRVNHCVITDFDRVDRFDSKVFKTIKL